MEMEMRVGGGGSAAPTRPTPVEQISGKAAELRVENGKERGRR